MGKKTTREKQKSADRCASKRFVERSGCWNPCHHRDRILQTQVLDQSRRYLFPGTEKGVAILMIITRVSLRCRHGRGIWIWKMMSIIRFQRRLSTLLLSLRLLLRILSLRCGELPQVDRHR